MSAIDISRIRNFSIIAHIDHGKSTLADRILEVAGIMNDRNRREQILDSMELERERGITIKSKTVHLEYKADNGKKYFFNLIDTPGHVDFNYEVSRALAACEGVLLLVDATQGVEAQTVANYFLALDNDLVIIPVINKIDLLSSDIKTVKAQIVNSLGLQEEDILYVSAKTGQGVKELLEAVVNRIPRPKGNPKAPLKALIFDSFYNSYHGAIIIFRIFDGSVRKGDKIRLMAVNEVFDVVQIGYFQLDIQQVTSMNTGEVGYMSCSIKDIAKAKIGDTITIASNPTIEPLPGYKDVKPMVFAGFYPLESDKYIDLGKSLEKLKLNDASLHFLPESSALGFGYRCGFLGLLHMDIIQERIQREFNIDIVRTAPNTTYKVNLKNGKIIEIESPSEFPEPHLIESIEEPYLALSIMVPERFIGKVMELVQARRGIHKNMEFLSSDKVMLDYEIPLSEIITDFYDRLKSITSGYASMDYNLIGYRGGNLVKVDILVNGKPVDTLSIIIHRDSAVRIGREIIHKLQKLIPRHLFKIPLQAAIGSQVIAREDIAPLRKNVTAKCYGGDITRKRKLLEKQKAGKKKMKSIGNVSIPQEAFLAVMRME